ncbi:hypothetical protein MTO96_024823 [Rhipicephalus appendiculatus]
MIPAAPRRRQGRCRCGVISCRGDSSAASRIPPPFSLEGPNLDPLSLPSLRARRRRPSACVYERGTYTGAGNNKKRLPHPTPSSSRAWPNQECFVRS